MKLFSFCSKFHEEASEWTVIHLSLQTHLGTTEESGLSRRNSEIDLIFPQIFNRINLKAGIRSGNAGAAVSGSS